MRTPDLHAPRPATMVIAAALIALTWACGDADPPPPDQMYPDAPQTTPPAGPVEDVLHAVTALEPVDGSGVSGEAMAMHSDTEVTVSIDLEGLPEARDYAAHIHSGTCAGGGGVAAPLNPVIGTADGRGTGTTTVNTDELPPDQPVFIQVHGEGGAPIACGDIEGHGS